MPRKLRSGLTPPVNGEEAAWMYMGSDLLFRAQNIHDANIYNVPKESTSFVYAETDIIDFQADNDRWML